jgi:hypothetical protein
VAPTGISALRIPAPDRAMLEASLIQRDETTGLDVHVANTIELRREAWACTHRQYVRLGLTEALPSACWFDLFHLDPQTMTFLVRTGGQTVATVSLVVSSPIGLPAREGYPLGVEKLLRNNRPCELVSLACDIEEPIKGRIILESMFRALYWSALVLRGCDRMVAVVHPHHAGYYTRRLGFTIIDADVKGCERVNNAPGVLICLDLHEAPRWFRGRHGTSPTSLASFFTDPVCGSKLVSAIARMFRPLVPKQVEALIEDTRIQAVGITREQRNYLGVSYPSMRLKKVS